MKLEIWTDGTSRPKMISKKNKSKDGPAAIAVLIKNNGKTLIKESKYVGMLDNNQAEYEAFIRAIELLSEMNIDNVVFYTDSNLLEKQMNNQYGAYKESISNYYSKAKSMLEEIPNWEVIWVPRSENREADKLASSCILSWQKDNLDI